MRLGQNEDLNPEDYLKEFFQSKENLLNIDKELESVREVRQSLIESGPNSDYVKKMLGFS